jgi:hypothetical protein
MIFTYDKKEGYYRLRNKMNSTVKTMPEVAVLFNSENGEIKGYGPTLEMHKRHLALAELGQLQYELFRSSELNLPVFNEVINNTVNILEVIENRTIADKYYISYYPTGWKPYQFKMKTES